MTLAIIGAGLSGLIAATQFPHAQVYEANGPEHVAHRALLRFRTDSLSRLVGIPFRKVTVRKAIWYRGQHREPNVAFANQYSRKTNGGYLSRSIWQLDPVERFIAPEDLQLQLIQMAERRIHWNSPFSMDDFQDSKEPIISTMPMPLLARIAKYPFALSNDDFRSASIEVDRYRLNGADVFQTVYYPDPDMAAYRASITGNLLIIERVKGAEGLHMEFEAILSSFGLLPADVTPIEKGHTQRFGKIAPIDDRARRDFIYQMTVQHQIYSLGRFATWRNILLDDVVQDVAIIKRLINQGHYGAALQHHAADAAKELA